MKQVISILILFSWTLSSLSAKTESLLVLDYTTHVQSIVKQNSKSESPDHYQSFSEIDLKDEKSRLLLLTLVFILPELNDLYWYSNLTYYSAHCHEFHASEVIPIHSPQYITNRQILI